MQFSIITKDLKPLILSSTLLSTAFGFAYNDVDLSSQIKTEIANAQTSQHLSLVDSDIYSRVALKQTFEQLYEQWQKNTMFFSFAHQITSDENYQKIIEMGKKAAPFILEKLKESPSLIVWALNDIYGKKISNNPNLTIEQACKLWVESIS